MDFLKIVGLILLKKKNNFLGNIYNIYFILFYLLFVNLILYIYHFY